MKKIIPALLIILGSVGVASAVEIGVNGQAVVGMSTDLVGGKGQNTDEPLTNDTTPIMGQRLRTDIYFKAVFSPDYEFNMGFSADNYHQNSAYDYQLTGDPYTGYELIGSNARRYVSLNVYTAALTMRGMAWGANVAVGALPLRWGGKGYYNFYQHDLDGRYFLADMDLVGFSFANPQGLIKWEIDAGSGYQGNPILGLKLNVSNLTVAFTSEGLYHDLGTLWDTRYQAELPPYWQTKINREIPWRTLGPWLSTSYMDTWHAGAEYTANWGLVESVFEFVFHSYKSDPYRSGNSGGTVWELYPDFIIHPSRFAQLDISGEMSQWKAYRNDFWGNGVSTQQSYRVFLEPAWLPSDTVLVGLGGELVKPGNFVDDLDTPRNENVDQHISVVPHILVQPMQGLQWDTRFYYKMWGNSWDVKDREVVDHITGQTTFYPGTPYKENLQYLFTTKCVVYF